MNRILPLLLLMFVITAAEAQKLKKVKHKLDQDYVEKYTVLKSDPKVKHGDYTVSKGKFTAVQGKYDHNKKVGYWTYYGPFSTIEGEDETMEYYEDGKQLWSKGMNESNYRTSHYDKDNNLDSMVYTIGDLILTEVYKPDTIMIHKRTEDGQIQIRGQFSRDKPVGTWYYELYGSSATMQFNDGNRFGQQTSYYPDGSIQSTYTADDSGRRHGNELTFFENGDTFIHCQYKNGKFHGLNRMWYSNGKLYMKAVYNEGRIISRSIFDKEGHLLDSLEGGVGTITLYTIEFKDNHTTLREDEPYARISIANGLYHGEYHSIKYDTTYTYVHGVREGRDPTDTSYLYPYDLEIEGGIKQRAFGGSSDNESLVSFIGKELHYPRGALDEGVEGRVLLEFIINEIGEIEDIDVISTRIGYQLDEEAMNVVYKSSKFWIPKTRFGMPQRVRYRLPIRFALR